MIEAVIVYGNEKIDTINAIRNQIDEKFYKADFYDDSSYHVIVFEEDEPVATGRLIPKDNYFLEKICVINSKRNMYYGDLVVKMLLDKAFNLGALEIFAYVPSSVIGFFTNIGFYNVNQNENSERDLTKMVITKAALKKCSH